MKLAKALMIRADLQTRIAHIKRRVLGNAKIQEGDKPTEDPEVLLKEIDVLTTEFENLVKHINRTNISSEFDGDVTMTDALAQRDALAVRRNVYHELLESVTSQQSSRRGRLEIKFEIIVDVPGMQRRYDDIAKQYRQLDMKIQERNWQIDLILTL